MSRSDVDKVRAQSKAGNYGPWQTHYDEMAKKTVIRRLFKYLPVSIELATAVAMDEKADAGLGQDNGAILTGEYSTVDESQHEQLPDNVNADTGEWQPTEAELAAIHAKEMAEANGDLLGDLPQ